jgi:mitochondrial chaperone BCS1
MLKLIVLPEPIRRFLEHYPDIDAQQDIWEVNPYRLDRGYSNPWTRRSRPRRPIDSIATTTEQKAIKEKIWLFFSRGEFYSKKSLPYRQGFFFHGPPGTGKSSMATAVASDFRMSIYVVPLSGLLDTQFQNLISSIPSRCVIVFEDIDAAGLGRKEGSTNKGISLSVFLAALDGIGGGSLIFMTTNHPETIDDAILRPGRVDHRVEFPYASKDQAKQLFRRLLCSDEDNTEDEIEQLVQTFSKGIPEGRLTTAQIEHYLMSHFGNPAAAAENVSEWADKEAAISK